VPDGLRPRYRDRFGHDVVIGYGLTEAPASVAQEDADGPRPRGATGRALPHVQLRILDDGGVEVPTGVEGEICVAPSPEGPWRGVWSPFLGYWRRPDATRASLRGGVLHTGDIGYLDGDGHLYVTGRSNDVILRGGANVYPAEVERVILEVDGVEDVAVVAVADERLGEVPAAVLTVRAGAAVDGDAVIAHCREYLARYKVPVSVTVVDRLPRNAMGKVDRPATRRLLEEVAG
jgi:acyl-CoA synthetase (AMP-forming)/AMP-acid ligase II